MKKLVVFTCILVIGLVLGAMFGGCTAAENARLKIVTSTSHLEQLVKRIGGDLVDVVNLVPPASHPGDFDASPVDMRKLADADLFLWHNWPGEVYVEGLIESADNPELTVITIEVAGSWMTPPVMLPAVDKVVAVLSQADNENTPTYEESGGTYKDVITAKGIEIKGRLAGAGIPGINVLCAGWQAGFAGWAGFNIAGTYGLPVAPTLQDIENLIETGREAGVALVIDNLHDNPDAGWPMAEALNCPRVILHNFPGVDESTGTWEETLDHNVGLILEALAE